MTEASRAALWESTREVQPIGATVSVIVPNVAAGSDDTSTIGVAPVTGTVTAVTFVPDAAMTGNDTNYRTVSIVNKGDDGSGSTTVASLAFTSGTDATAFDAKTITLSATAANLEVTAGDVLAWSSVHTATGIVDPGGYVEVTISHG